VVSTDRKSTILVVDDMTENIEVLNAILKADYRVLFATNGKDALEVAISDSPDLILLDIMMPEMDGYEICQCLKDETETQNIPVIFITAMNEVEDETLGFKTGAVDYIIKPINQHVVRARIKTHLALNFAKQRLLELNEQLLYERELIEDTLCYLEQSIHFDPQNLRIIRRPIEKNSGDIIFSAFRPDGTQHIMLGDFTGHGLHAAIGGPLVSDIFYTDTAKKIDMQEIISKVNQRLFQALRVDVFMAGCFIAFNPKLQLMTILNAALPDVFLLRNGSCYRRFRSINMPLGILDTECKKGETIPVKPGDRIFVYSDGIVEEKGLDQEMFGMDRLQTLLEDIVTHNKPLEEIHSALDRFRMGHGNHGDDISLFELTI
jgi:two-component system, HptB-dependent secretion and biofilm response regulator